MRSKRPLKKAPIFDEEGYRKDFYRTVLNVKPLFGEFLDSISQSTSEDHSHVLGSRRLTLEELQTKIADQIKQRLERNREKLYSQRPLDTIERDNTWIREVQQALQQLSDFIKAADYLKSQRINDYLQMDIQPIKKEILSSLQVIYFVLQLSTEPEQFKILTKALLLDIDLMETKAKEYFDRGLHRNQKIQSAISSGNVEEFIKVLQEEIQKLGSRLVAQEEELKKLILSESDQQLVSEKIYSIISSKVAEYHDQIKTMILLKNEKKTYI